jgi:hypothetical protein
MMHPNNGCVRIYNKLEISSFQLEDSMKLQHHYYLKASLFASLVVVFSVVLAACQPAAAPAPTLAPSPVPTETSTPAPTLAPTPVVNPALSVSNQAIKSGHITIADVFSIGPGWVVIQAQSHSKPGAVIGHAAVKAGDNKKVVVKINAAKATTLVYASLHSDAGTTGKFEFPGPDSAVSAAGQAVNLTFKITGGIVHASSSGSSQQSGGSNPIPVTGPTAMPRPLPTMVPVWPGY